MADDKPKLSFQTIVYIVMVVLCFIYFIWSSLSSMRSSDSNYQDVPPVRTGK